MSDSRKKKEIRQEFQKKRIRQEILEKGIRQEFQEKKRIRQEFKNTRILPGETFLASPGKIRSTRILQKGKICFFRQESCIEGMAKES